MDTSLRNRIRFPTELPTALKWVRHWHLLPLIPFAYGWLAVLRVNAANPRVQQGDDSVFELLIGVGIFALISLLIVLARHLRRAERTAWRWTGYALTTLSIPTWLLAFLLACGYAALDGHSLHIGC